MKWVILPSGEHLVLRSPITSPIHPCHGKWELVRSDGSCLYLSLEELAKLPTFVKFLPPTSPFLPFSNRPLGFLQDLRLLRKQLVIGRKRASRGEPKPRAKKSPTTRKSEVTISQTLLTQGLPADLAASLAKAGAALLGRRKK